MNCKFTLKYSYGVTVVVEANTYQDFLSKIVPSQLANNKVLGWLVGMKDIKLGARYSYHPTGGYSVLLTKEKVNG